MIEVPTTITGDAAIRAFTLAVADAFVASGHAGPNAGSQAVVDIAEQYRAFVQSGNTHA